MSSVQTADAVSRSLYARLKERVADPRKVWGLPWGFSGLDEMTGGIHKQEMTLAFARPAVGKSFFLAQAALNAAYYLLTDDGKARYPDQVVRLVLCEMSADQFQDRLICNMAHLQPRRVRSGHLSEPEQRAYHRAANELARLPVEYLDEPGNMANVEEFVRAGKRCALWGLDYIGIMPDREADPYRRISRLSGQCRQLCRDVAPGLVLAQMSRSVEKREDKRPLLSDLRDSGSLEQDAVNAIGLYRDDVYKKVADEDRLLPRPAEFIVLKQRNGPIGTVNVTWMPEPPGWVDPSALEDELGELPE